jgi:glycosyltransferase involved in cell wall biosynthesis
MPDRKLLIITFHFPPMAGAGVFRVLGFVRHLPAFGWQSVVVAPPRFSLEPIDEALLGRVPPETAVYHVPYPEGSIWKVIHRFYPGNVWPKLAAAASHRAIRQHRPDAILTSGPPHFTHLLGRHLRRWTGLPWVADFRDPWVAGDRSPVTWTIRNRDQRDESSVMREADAIVANTPGSLDLLCRAYPQYAAKMSAITNGYDPEEFATSPEPRRSGSTIEIVHTGVIYANRSPIPFLDAVKRLEVVALGGRTVRVRLIGDFVDARQKEQIEHSVREGMKASVSLEGRVPYAESIRTIVQADVLLLLDSPGRRAGVPAKLYEYIGAGRPILALAEPECDVAWVLRESGLPHRVAPPLNPEAIRCALEGLLQDPAIHRGTRQDACNARFTRQRLTGELATLLDSCVGGSPCEADERLVPRSV